MNFLEELEKLKVRAQGGKEELWYGFAEGMRVTPEDRRDALWDIRNLEGKSEPPQAVQTFATHPGVDVLRQLKTIHPKAPLPGVKPYTDEFFVMRGREGLNFGPNAPANLKAGDKAGVEKYKRLLREQSVLRKMGFLSGAATNDLVQDGSRGIWWLLNASQAVGKITAELGAATLSPDLFARREVPLQEAIDKGWVNYKQPFFDKEVVSGRAKEIADIDDAKLLAKLTNIDPTKPEYTLEDYEKESAVVNESARRKAFKQLEAEARDDAINYKRARPGVKIRGRKIMKNRFNPNLVTAAAIIPSALGINAGIGIIGGHEGYQAVVPDEDDPRKTANPIAEFAARYVTGKEGRLMEAEDFLLARPDVTMGEYNQYRNYLRDRDIDLNPFDDGKVNLGGLLKTNPDGIRGGEVSFMGKSLPVNDTLLPSIGAVAGTALGAALTNAGSIRMRGGFKGRKGLGKALGFMPEVLPRDKKTAKRVYAQAEDAYGMKPKDTFINKMQAEFDKDDGWKHNARVLGTVGGMGMAGLAAGNALGTSIEDERRRRNFAENNPGVDYDVYKKRAAETLDNKIKLAQSNPNSSEERGKSRVGFNKRGYQQSLLDGALTNQAQIDSIVNEEKKARANQLQSDGMQGIAKADLRIRQMDLMADDSKLSSYDAAKQSYEDAIMEVGQKYLEGERRRQERKEREEATPLYEVNMMPSKLS